MLFSKILLPTLFMTLSYTSFGQVALGYANSEYVLTSHPLYEKGLEDLKTEQADMSKQFETKQKSLQLKVEEYSNMIVNNASESAIKEKQTELEELDAEINKMAKDFELYLSMKKDQIMDPILESTNDALKSVCKDLKLNAILQSTNNEGVSFVLHAPDETDVNQYLLRETKSGKALIFATEYKSDPASVKIGYTNIEMVLMYMPEYMAMAQEMETHTDKLSKEYDEKSEELYKVVEEYQSKEEKGMLAPNGKKFYQRKITELQTELEVLKVEGEDKLEAIRKEKMEVVLTKLQGAINKVVEDNGFTLILNQTTSSGVSTIVHGPEEGDITYALLDALGTNVDSFEKNNLEAKGNVKVGFVNVEAIMIGMPEFETAKKNIEAYEESIIKEQEAQSEILSNEEMQKYLEKAENDFQYYRGEQLQPIMSTIQAEIDKIAEKGSYDYIINQTGGNVLYIAKKSDLNQTLKKALGIK